MTETHPSDDEIAAYSARRLGAEEAAGVERHLIECGECRDKVTLGMIIRDERRRTTWRYWIPVGIAAAAVLTVITTSSRNDPYRELGLVAQAPAYEGIPVRAERAHSDSLFSAGMQSYKNGRFADAIAHLTSARDAGADSLATTFFVGASLLMTNSPSAAERELQRAGKMEGSPYQAESHYYRAKALLQTGAVDSALASLARAAGLENAQRAAAAALADSVMRARSAR